MAQEFWLCGCSKNHPNKHPMSETVCNHCGWELKPIQDEIMELVEDITTLEKQRAALWKRLKYLLNKEHKSPDKFISLIEVLTGD